MTSVTIPDSPASLTEALGIALPNNAALPAPPATKWATTTKNILLKKF